MVMVQPPGDNFYVTRRELNELLTVFARHFDESLALSEQRTHAEIVAAEGRIRAETTALIAASEQRTRADIAATEQRIRAEMMAQIAASEQRTVAVMASIGNDLSHQIRDVFTTLKTLIEMKK